MITIHKTFFPLAVLVLCTAGVEASTRLVDVRDGRVVKGLSGKDPQSLATLVSRQPDLEKEKKALLSQHKSDREAHLKTDVDQLLRASPEMMISVSSGKIERNPREKTKKFFAEYFRGATYYEWDDLEEPIVRVSRDATMGWIIVRLKVRRSQKNADGVTREVKFVYAGIMTYEKVNGRWMKVANVSTFEPQ